MGSWSDPAAAPAGLADWRLHQPVALGIRKSVRLVERVLPYVLISCSRVRRQHDDRV
jgi:hypothetical protein